jgi:hypothetical protein
MKKMKVNFVNGEETFQTPKDRETNSPMKFGKW